jgi:glutamate racemase
LFVPLVEEGLITGDIPTLIARSYLEHFKNRDVDTIILGCTHYPILERIIRKVLGEEIKLVDSGKPTAGVVENILNENLLVSDNKKGKIYSFVTDSKNEFEKVIKKSLAQLFKIDITSTTLIDLH